jgi:hypothetical protein
MQFHSPSVVQAVPATLAEPPTDGTVPVPEGEAEDATGEAATDVAKVVLREAFAEEVAVGFGVVPAAAVVVPTVMKTPPETVGAGPVPVPAAAVVVALAVVVATAVVGATEAPPVAFILAGQLNNWRASVLVARPRLSTESPGLGKMISAPANFVSLVSHPLPMFPTSISGRALNAAWSRSTSSCLLVVEEVMEMAAQFMYISRLPTLLNQDQAKVPFPVGSVDGILKEYVDGSIAFASLPLLPATPWMGHPPTME